MESRMSQQLVESERGFFPPQTQQYVEMPATAINIGMPPLPIKDHFLWSIFNFAFCNFCCLGFLALVFSVKARDQKVLGNIYEANHHGFTSKALNLTATILSILFFVIVFGLLVGGVISVYQR
ncbi:dispanin subfamily A member 2b-like [Mobula hypostoma]|uniref:dispanin subfamily A member 2b-like n=1 Tax=Mobula hypostoma TaxID=723540 RepID=UPI002FC38A19